MGAKKAWKESGIKALVSAFFAESKRGDVGTERKSNDFWNAVAEAPMLKKEMRSAEACQRKFAAIQREVQRFSGCLNQAKQFGSKELDNADLQDVIDEKDEAVRSIIDAGMELGKGMSGLTEENYVARAHLLYLKQYKGMFDFSYILDIFFENPKYWGQEAITEKSEKQVASSGTGESEGVADDYGKKKTKAEMHRIRQGEDNLKIQKQMVETSNKKAKLMEEKLAIDAAKLDLFRKAEKEKQEQAVFSNPLVPEELRRQYWEKKAQEILNSDKQ